MPALAANGTIAFGATLAPGQTLLVPVFEDAVLLPAGAAASIHAGDGSAVAWHRIAAAPHHALVELNGKAGALLAVCQSGICQKYRVVRVD